MKRLFFGIALLLGIVVASKAEIVTVPIPGAPGLSVTVGTGANALPLDQINNNPNAVNVQMGDDQYTQIPLGFTFPYFGQQFNTSWMYSNGLVGFNPPTGAGQWAYCCEGVNLTTTTDPQYNYLIAPLWTDLIGWGQNHYYLSEPNKMTYGWYNVSECCGSSGGNSFEVSINSLGKVDTRIGGAMISYHNVTSGMTGDLSKGEYYQNYYGYGWNVTQPFSWSVLDGTGVNMCTVNPLSSPSCPGYAAAFLEQQCSINPLYSTSCYGYQQAYHDYQCNVNPLYATDCVGYATAYHNYQCSLDPLYATTCQGYQEAYFSKMCKENGLYDRQCPNYAEAYATQQALITPTTPTTPTVTQTSSSSNQSAAAIIADPVVNNVVTSTSTTTSPAAAAPVVPLVSTPAASNNNAQPQQATAEPKSNTESKPATAEVKQETKTEQKTARQEIQERRMEAAKREAVAKAQEVAKNADQAQSMEQQVAVQNFVINAMGYNPAFDAYNGVKLPDGQGYKPYDIYKNQTNVDNRRAGVRLFGASDSVHQNMVDSQFKGLQDVTGNN